MKNTIRIKLVAIFFFYFFVSCNDFSTQTFPNESNNLQSVTTQELVNNSLTFFDGKAYSKSPVVYKAELIENKLSEIYSGFAGVWIPTDKSNTVTIAVQTNQNFDNNRNTLLELFSNTLLDNL